MILALMVKVNLLIKGCGVRIVKLRKIDINNTIRIDSLILLTCFCWLAIIISLINMVRELAFSLWFELLNC